MQLLSLSADLGFGLGLRSLDPALALLGTNAEGLAIDGPSLRAVVRSPGLNWSGNINDLLTYADPSTKWIVNKAGVLESGTALRCEYDPVTGVALGVRVEPQATNLLKQSKSSGSPWTVANTASGVSVVAVADAGEAPDGSITATKLTFPVQPAGSNSVWRQNVSGLTNPTQLAPSCFLRADSPLTICLRSGSGGVYLPCNLTTEWQRFEITPGNNASTSFAFDIAPKALLIDTMTAEKVVYVWGAQLEVGGGSSSYIPTDTSAATRAADDLTMPLTAFPWNGGSGTLKLNGATVTPILNGASDALDIAALAAAAGATHVKTLTWVPA